MARSAADAQKISELLRELGRRARGAGRVYLTGGASVLLVGWRAMTVDIDRKLDPEPAGAFEAIARLNNDLDVNGELKPPTHDEVQPVAEHPARRVAVSCERMGRRFDGPDVDVTVCGRCGGKLRLLEVCTTGYAIARLLRDEGIEPVTHARAPPSAAQLQLAL